MLTAATVVFPKPKEALTHQSDFLQACQHRGNANAVYF